MAVNIKQAEIIPKGESFQGARCINNDIKGHFVTFVPILLISHLSRRGVETILNSLAK